MAVAFLGACGSSASSNDETSRFGSGDVGTLNYLLTLEYLQAAFYAEAVGGGLFAGSQLTTLRKFGEEEREHVAALARAIKQLHGKSAAKPKAEFKLTDAGSALKLAGKIESMGAAAYLGQLQNFESPAALATALSIHSVEGRHSATVNAELGEPISPDGAFAKPATAKTALGFFETFIA